MFMQRRAVATPRDETGAARWQLGQHPVSAGAIRENGEHARTGAGQTRLAELRQPACGGGDFGIAAVNHRLAIVAT